MRNLRVGIVGARGMVGSVLLERMIECGDFAKINATFFSTSLAGSSIDCLLNKDNKSSLLAQTSTACGVNERILNARHVNDFLDLDCIISTQGSEYTNEMLPILRANGYKGYFIDASSALRQNNDCVIALDPINKEQILKALASGIKNFSGANCSISLSMLALAGLLKEDGLVECISMMSYQAASGAGAGLVSDLLAQNNYLAQHLANDTQNNQQTPILQLLNNALSGLKSQNMPTGSLPCSLMANVLPWIDSDLGNGISREEFKAEVELNKILGLNPNSPNYIKVDGICVRVPVLRSHCAGLTFKLNSRNPIAFNEDELLTRIQKAHPWVEVISNNKVNTLQKLQPIATSNTLKVAIGRFRKTNLNFADSRATNNDAHSSVYVAFTCADQLLWGAAEPLRRMLNILVQHTTQQ